MTIELRIGNATARLDAGNPGVRIGRDPASVQVVADDPTVSRRHCEVYLQGDQALIRDMGSSNGTWVDGQPVGAQPVALRPGQQVFVGHMPLQVAWGGGATVMGALPPELRALMEARRRGAQVQVSTPSRASGPETQNLPYRRQGTNDNGVLLIALPDESFANEGTLQGFAEFTALDDETVNEIAIELVEVHRKGPRGGHVWDRVIVKQGPWQCRRNDRVPMPFELRIPAATAMSDKEVHWEVRGVVDVAWAYDVEVEVPIQMGNRDVERLRDGMGLLDLRVDAIVSKPKGQEFSMVFVPPGQWRDQWNIDRVNVELQYLGTNLQIELEVDKRGAFSKDRKTRYVVDQTRFRSLSLEQVAGELQGLVQRMLAL